MPCRKRGLLVTGLVAVCLVVAGCSSGTEEAAADVGRTSDEPAHRTAAAEKARHAYVDPCSLLKRDERRSIAGTPVVPSSLSGHVDPASVDMNRCTLSKRDVPGDALALHYGYAVTPQVKLDKYIKQNRRYDDMHVEAVSGVGDEAFILTGSTMLGTYYQAWARTGDYTVYVWTTNPRFDPAAAAQALTYLLERVTPGMLEHPVHLGKQCPKATDRHVVSALGGEVVRALGWQRRSKVVCTYASRSQRLRLSTVSKTKKQLQESLRSARLTEEYLGTGGQQVLRVVANAKTLLNPSEYGPFAYTYMHGPPAVISADLGEASRVGDRPGFPYPSYDQAAFRSVNAWWVRRVAARLRK